MKTLVKKFTNLLIYLSLIGGASVATATAGWLEMRIKITVSGFSYIVELPQK